MNQAFYGLLSAGWSIEETEGKGPRGSLPPDAILAEHVVGLLDVERGSGHPMGPEQLREALSAKGLPASTLDDAAIDRIRTRRGQLLQDWRALPEGGTLELAFG